MIKSIAWAVTVFMLGGAAAQGQGELALLSPGSLQPEVEKLIPMWESKTGRKVKITIAAGGLNKQSVIRGDVFDVVILQPPYPEVLASGNLVADSATPLASVTLGVAVKKGAPRPDMSTPEAVKKMFLAAKSVSYPEEAGGTSAATFKKILDKLGIMEQMQPKFRVAERGGPVMALVAKGEAELGITFMSGMNQPGIDVVGPFPSEVSPPTEFVGFVGAHSKDAAAAKAILEYLSSSEAIAVYKARGMDRGHAGK